MFKYLYSIVLYAIFFLSLSCTALDPSGSFLQYEKIENTPEPQLTIKNHSDLETTVYVQGDQKSETLVIEARKDTTITLPPGFYIVEAQASGTMSNKTTNLLQPNQRYILHLYMGMK